MASSDAQQAIRSGEAERPERDRREAETASQPVTSDTAMIKTAATAPAWSAADEQNAREMTREVVGESPSGANRDMTRNVPKEMVERLQSCGCHRVRVTNRKLLPAERARAIEAAAMLGRKAYLSYRYPYLYIRLGEPTLTLDSSESLGELATAPAVRPEGEGTGGTAQRPVVASVMRVGRGRVMERRDAEGIAREAKAISHDLAARERP
jgi:hypothetical protein